MEKAVNTFAPVATARRSYAKVWTEMTRDKLLQTSSGTLVTCQLWSKSRGKMWGITTTTTFLFCISLQYHILYIHTLLTWLTLGHKASLQISHMLNTEYYAVCALKLCFRPMALRLSVIHLKKWPEIISSLCVRIFVIVIKSVDYYWVIHVDVELRECLFPTSLPNLIHKL